MATLSPPAVPWLSIRLHLISGGLTESTRNTHYSLRHARCIHELLTRCKVALAARPAPHRKLPEDFFRCIFVYISLLWDPYPEASLETHSCPEISPREMFSIGTFKFDGDNILTLLLVFRNLPHVPWSRLRRLDLKWSEGDVPMIGNGFVICASIYT